MSDSPTTPRRLSALVLLVALGLRLASLDFGLDSDPWLTELGNSQDELSMARAALAGPLAGNSDPGVFINWGSGALWTFAACDATVALANGFERTVTCWRQNISDLLWLHRLVSALAGVATVAILISAARRLAGPWVGLAAGLLLATCYLHVRDSHLGTTDVLLTLWTTAAWHAAWCWRAARRDGRTDTRVPALLCGVAVGLALATKTVGLLAVGFPLCAWWTAGRGPSRRAALPELLACLGLAALCWLALSPHLLDDAASAGEHLRLNSERLLAGPSDLPSLLTWHMTQSLGVGLGWPAVALAALGAWTLLFGPGATSDTRAALLCLLPTGASVLLFRVPAVRYALPVLPGVCLFAAIGVQQSARWLADRSPAGARRRPWYAALVLVAALTPSVARSVQFNRLLDVRDTRIDAALHLRQLGAPAVDVLAFGHYGLPNRLSPPGAPLYVPFQYWAAAHTGDAPLASDPAALFATTLSLVQADPPPLVLVERHAATFEEQALEALRELLTTRYTLAAAFDGGADDAAATRTDVGAASFGVPWAAPGSVVRPGPALDIYRLRED